MISMYFSSQSISLIPLSNFTCAHEVNNLNEKMNEIIDIQKLNNDRVFYTSYSPIYIPVKAQNLIKRIDRTLHHVECRQFSKIGQILTIISRHRYALQLSSCLQRNSIWTQYSFCSNFITVIWLLQFQCRYEFFEMSQRRMI